GVVNWLQRQPERENRGYDDIQQELRLQSMHWGGLFLEYDLNLRPPLLLGPGDTLLIGGIFWPQGPGPRMATLSFQVSNHYGAPVNIQAVGNTTAANAAATLMPNDIPFEFPNWTRHAIIVSTGSTPVLVNRLRLEDPTTWFVVNVVPPPGGFTPSSVAQYQINPGDALTIEIQYIPQGS